MGAQGLGSSFDSVFAAFAATARAHPGNAFLCVPPLPHRDYHPGGFEIGYGQALGQIEALAHSYAQAGYGPGHRVALMLDNRPGHLLHLLALNGLGVSIVPVNPDYLHHELLYLLDHSEADLAVVLAKHAPRMEKAAAERAKPLPVAVADTGFSDIPTALSPKRSGSDHGSGNRATEAGILYTSGTTGRPKGCLLDNEYFLNSGQWYAEIGGAVTLTHGRERVLNPLPLFHMNAGIILPAALILTANCLIVPDRFHPSTWWQDLIATRATAFHYLGIVPPILMKQPAALHDRQHTVRWGIGAGIEPELHRAFEERFGVTMVEVWGMTETGRVFVDAFEPRQITTRAFGRPTPVLQARVVDEHDNVVATGSPGELLVRASGDNPRHGFFRGYLKDEAATRMAWQGGWFHTGDVVTQSPDGMLYFVERKKNIIRRSGENISAAEVENGLIGHAAVLRVAVLSVADELRDEEVMAAIVLAEGFQSSRDNAISIVDAAREKLSYFKLPGWVVFVEALPTTGTQKVQKGLIFAKDTDPRAHPHAFDLRSLKVRAKT